MSDKLNIGGREVDTLTGWASNYVHPDGETKGIKLPTAGNYVDKAKKEGWLKPALSTGGSYFYFVEDLDKLPGLYGRKPAIKAIHPEQHDAVVKDNVRLAAENVELSSVIEYLNDRIEMLQAALKAAESYSNSIITGEPVELLEYSNV